MYGNEIMVWKEKEKSKIIAVQMDKVRTIIGVRRSNRIRNKRMR